MKIVILHDDLPAAASADQADVFAQIKAVSAALDELGHQSVVLPFSLNLEAVRGELARIRPDLVFNLVESVAGQGRLIHLAPALLDAVGFPYVGAGTEAMFQTSGKPLAKERLRDRGVATPRWYTLDSLETDEWVPGRYIVKSAWEEASVGLDEDSVVHVDHPWALKEEIERRLPALGGDGFAEAYIDGREFNLAVLAGPDGPEVLPPAEIEFVGYGEGKPRVVGYRAKWDESSYEYHHTPRRFELPPSDGALIARLTQIAEECWRLFGLLGWARVDFRVDAVEQPWVLEVNANPCLSPDAGFAAAVERGGIGYTRAIARILEDFGAGGSHAGCSESAIPQRII